MTEQPHPATGMPLQPPGSEGGNPAWRRALAEKQRLLDSMREQRGGH